MEQGVLPARESAPPLAKLVLIAGVLAGVSYVASWGLDLPQAASLTWKGAGVGLLALYAALLARTRDGWLIATVLAFGAAGDVLLEAAGLIVGAVAFLGGHVVAVVLYLRNRSPRLGPADWLAAMIFPPAVAIWSVLLADDRTLGPGLALYAFGLGAMAATAWISRFPRALAGVGALMFVASDLFLFARMHALVGQAWVDFAVWVLYFGGQALICVGVTRQTR